MPSSKPCAAFEPISPDFDLAALVETTPNFEYVVRISCNMIDHQGLENFEKLVLLHVVLGGKPLVIEGYHERLDRWSFGLQWLKDNCAQKVENARDLTKKTNLPLSIGHYLNNMALLTNQWNARNYKDADRQRIYLKDIDCPHLWHDKLQDLIPLGLFYLNESTGDVGGLGSVDEHDPHGPGMRRGRGIAKAGDLMSSLPSEMRAENLMCYIGHEGTYTPSHREMCASLGQNIMIETSTGLVEDGKPTKPGSSIWFMTESKDREVVSEYWLSILGHDIEVENHFAQVNAWKAAPFKTWVIEQRVGDFILIPPLAPHQVWNRGTRTMKVAWNRTTVETLEMALNEALPRARMVCRDEQYKNKAIIYYTLMKYSRLLKAAEKQKSKRQGSKPGSKDSISAKIRQLEKDFRRLQSLFSQIMISESFLPGQEQKKVELIPFDGNITCSYCRCNIFNRFLTCPSCIGELPNGDEDTYDICMECYAMGRSCACISKLKWVEQFPWGELTQKHDQWRHQVIQFEGQITEKTPKSLKTEMEIMGKKRTLAQICQIELKKRPWRDIKKPVPPVEGVEREEEIEVDANGNTKKKRKVRRSEKFKREHKACHVDKHWEPKWKQAECSHCDYSFCYGTLFRGYDMMPQQVMADPDWKCPRCLNICNCRDCREKPGWKHFAPSGTMLGHDTKKIADPRSVESLVDFSFSNLSWIQKAGDDHPHDTMRLNKRRKAADEAKARETELGDDYVEDVDAEGDTDDVESRILQLAHQEGIPIDPALGASNEMSQIDNDSQDDFESYNENPEELAAPFEYSSQRPLAPQYVVPEGGVIRNAEHAYDSTEAITYDYPDPELGVHVPVEPEQPTEQTIPGYEAAVPPPLPDQIEMVNRKRKRMTRVEEGDKPYGAKKSSDKTRKKPKRSLIVKLIVNRVRLSKFVQTAATAQRALDGAVDKAPVISSDLRALNAEWNIPESQIPTKKARVEHIVEEVDDEFTPSRRRDRRKSAPNPEPEPSRRTTRMQMVTYGAPSDEEDFDDSDDSGAAPRDHAKSKWLLMRQAAEGESSQPSDDARDDSPPGVNHFITVSDDDDNDDEDRDSSEVKASSNKAPPSGAAQLRPLSSSFSKRHVAGVRQDEVLHSNSVMTPRLQQTNGAAVKSAEQLRVGRSATTSTGASSGPTPNRPAMQSKQQKSVTAGPAAKPTEKAASKVAREASANLKAKLAAVEWAENDEDSLESERAWSGSEEGSDRSASRKAAIESEKSSSKACAPTAENIVAIMAVPTTSAVDWNDSESSSGEEHVAASNQLKHTLSMPSWSAINQPTSPRVRYETAGQGRGQQPRAQAR